MNLNIEVNKKFFSQLKPHSITVLIYSLAYYEKYKKVPSMKQMAKYLKIGYHTIRKSLSEIYLLLKNDSHKNEAHNILNNRYSFIFSKAEHASATYINHIAHVDISKDVKIIWDNTVRIAKAYYGDSIKKYSDYYWRVGIKLNELVNKIGHDNIQEYTEWYFRSKAPRISYFNPSVFCHINIINDFKVDHGMVKAEKIKQINRDNEYEEESKEEEKRIFQKLIERKDAGTLDEYDEELLEYFKKQGRLDG